LTWLARAPLFAVDVAEAEVEEVVVVEAAVEEPEGPEAVGVAELERVTPTAAHSCWANSSAVARSLPVQED